VVLIGSVVTGCRWIARACGRSRRLTTDPIRTSTGRSAADEIDASGANVNTVNGFRTDHMPYGGFKDSGVGKEGIKYADEYFSRQKLVGFHQGFTT
jgi:acyl-CoA reductase-like NAD-dependent aldehyde dehydrogenase